VLGAFTSAQLAAALTDETGSGLAVFSASPALSGIPSAPTATAGTSTTQLATTAFATTADDLKASLAGATFTGNIVVPAATLSSQVANMGQVDSRVQGQVAVAFTTAGTATAYTLTPSPATTSYAAGQSFFVTFNAASGTSPTLQISGLATPPNLVKQQLNGTYANIAAGDIPANHCSRVTLLNATQALVETLVSYRKDTILGTVSQAAGVPTGSVIERGSNANGSYTRWADGTQICTVNIPAAGNVSIAIGGVFWTGSKAWVYPAAFSASPTCTGMESTGVGSCWCGLGTAGVGNTETSFAVFRATTFAATPTASLQVIGRWF
jgi:hypothetical protein